MAPQNLAELVDKAIRWYILGISMLTALMFFFVFTINWEDRFWGTKLDGLPAGIYLLAKGLIALFLVILMVKYREKIELLTVLAILYFGYLLAPTTLSLSSPVFDMPRYLAQLTIVLIVPVILLIAHRILHHDNKTATQ
jgi:hypothetical protein